MAAPSFGCVIPVRPPCDSLDDAIRSCQVQTYPPARIVVVFDGPAQGPHAPHLPGVISMGTRRDGGVAVARNTGARACADLDFVVFLDADDVSAPDRLEAVADAISQRPTVDVITSAGDLVASTGELLATLWDRPLTSDQSRARSILRMQAMQSSVVLRTTTLLGVGAYREGMRRGSDYELLMRLAARDATFSHIPRSLVSHRIHDGQMTRRERLRWADQAALRQCRRELARSLALPSGELVLTEVLATGMACAHEFRRLMAKVTGSVGLPQPRAPIEVAAKRRTRVAGRLIETLEQQLDRRSRRSDA